MQILFVFLSPLLALGESESGGWDVTCPADQVTCGDDENSEGGGACYVLGLRPQRLTAVPGAAEVHISVKTAAKYHAERLSILLLTWLQTVEPPPPGECIPPTRTDDGAEDEWTATATQHGIVCVCVCVCRKFLKISSSCVCSVSQVSESEELKGVRWGTAVDVCAASLGQSMSSFTRRLRTDHVIIDLKCIATPLLGLTHSVVCVCLCVCVCACVMCVCVSECVCVDGSAMLTMMST